MLLFVAAFYALHTTLVALYSRAPGPLWAHTRSACPELLNYAVHVAYMAVALAAVHMAQTLPNMLARSETLQLTQQQQQQRQSDVENPSSSPLTPDHDADDVVDGLVVAMPPPLPTSPSSAGSSSSSRTHSSPTRRFLLRVLWMTLSVAQKSAWVVLLVVQLQSNWDAFHVVDGLLDGHKRAAEASAEMAAASFIEGSASSLLPSSAVAAGLSSMNVPMAPLCGRGPSKHLLRWTLVCVIVSTALAISLLLVVGEEFAAGLRKRCRLAREATIRARRMHHQQQHALDTGSSSSKQHQHAGARAAAWRACCLACCFGIDVTAAAASVSSSSLSARGTGTSIGGHHAAASSSSASTLIATSSGNRAASAASSIVPSKRWIDLQTDELTDV